MNLESSSPKNLFYQDGLGLDSMTLILKLDLGMTKISHHTQQESHRAYGIAVSRVDIQLN